MARTHRASAPRNLDTSIPRLALLDADECLDRMARRSLGRLAFVRDGLPQILPMNYLLHQGSVLLRTQIGSTLDALIGQLVAFEIDEADPVAHDGWSVVVHGRADEVWEPQELEQLRLLPLRPWAPGDRSHYLRIQSTSMTGRRIT